MLPEMQHRSPPFYRRLPRPERATRGPLPRYKRGNEQLENIWPRRGAVARCVHSGKSMKECQAWTLSRVAACGLQTREAPLWPARCGRGQVCANEESREANRRGKGGFLSITQAWRVRINPAKTIACEQGRYKFRTFKHFIHSKTGSHNHRSNLRDLSE